MKKILMSALALVLAAGSMNAKNLEEARIYLNPGHGSWGPNDRPMATIPYPNLTETGRPDTCGFYESNTNLWKVLKLGTTLEGLGVKKENIMYSRVKNGPFPYVKGNPDEAIYNRSLSEICEEVEANNMDYFLSVHSNAATEGTSTNYPLFLYRGKDGKGNEYQPGSYDMANISWGFLNTNKIDPITSYSTSSNLRGDVSFYGSETGRVDPNGKTYYGSLGVLKHGCPGFLSEGYFHTYQPARHRALNPDYCRQEGIRYARGIAAYFGSQGEKTGYIMGFVKDLHEKIDNKLYNYGVGTDDQWLPLNGATVELYKNGTKIKEYTVDQNYNGVFVFEQLEPGDYTLDYKCVNYKPANPEYKEPVTVKANETTYVKAFLESESYIPPTPPTVIWENYPDPEQDGDIIVASQFNMKEDFKNSALTELADKTIRRSILRNDSLFVLAVDASKAPYLYIIDPTNQAILKTLDTSGTKGGIYALSDIAFTADGVLCASNMEETQFTPGGTFRVYKWGTNYEGAPVEWFTSQKSGNYNNANTGQTLAITGDSKKCRVITSATTTAASMNTRILIFNIEDGAKLNDVRNQDTPYSGSIWGADFKFTVSPRSNDNIIIDGSLTNPIEYKLNSVDVQPMTLVGNWNNTDLDVKATGANYFKYAKHSLMAAPVVNAEGKNSGIKLFDITDGLNKAKTIATEGISFDAEEAAYTMGGAMVNNADINLYLVKGNATASISKFTTKAVAQPTVMGIFAYDLTVITTTNSQEFKFTANDNAIEGNIIFTDAVTGEAKGSIAINNVIKGVNTITIDKSEIPLCDNKLNWAIELKGNVIPRVKRLNTDATEFQFIRLRGITVDNSTESNYFGRIYASTDKAGNAGSREVATGLYAYNADWTPINSTAYKGGATINSPYRMSTDSNGKLYMSEWSDPNSGVYLFNPANFDTALNLFREGTRDAKGLFTKDGVQLGGSTTSAFIIGSGENTKLYTYDEDYTASGLGKGNNVLCYNIGTADKLSSGPEKVFAVANITPNTNCQVIPDALGGIWVCQTRYAGNNTTGIPSFFYMNAEGVVKFNSGDLSEIINGSAGSAIAISNDGKTLVMNNGSSEFLFFDIHWTNDAPALAFKYKFKHSLGEGANAQVHQLAFDHAGNLFAAGKNLGIYAIPNSDNTNITAAKKSLAIDGGIITIAAPTNANAIRENGLVKFTWTAPVSTQFISYNLYVNDVKVNTADKNATSFDFDEPTADGEYKYGVTAVYANDVESTQASYSIKFSGIEDINSNTFTVYPNPTTGLVNIKSPEEISVVRVFSASGALVGEFNEATIDLSNLSTGTYYIKVNNLKVVPVIKK